ncbi:MULTISPECIES: hypothetical protein [unclassified Sedimentibacter]|uniref:hypothetical protein n=1 Tax=unclassified Sedimentibacter TaxID=2649220 RepID=UPI0027E099C6|nr:hypothetical protein [Sedimentibacter sp. MB35-C1]WMJ77237.1 hypothetical protein RBQ61_16970 [Sedimentibacter sp. MB35-C1]
MLLKSKDIAYLGVLLGLNQLFIILSSVIETNTIILFAAAALLVGVVIVEFGFKSGILFYVASCILGFFLTFNKVEIITYIIFFGLYSIVKYVEEIKINNAVLLYAAKFLYFNTALIAMYFTVKLFIPLELAWWMIIAAQVLFIIYDYAFTMFITTYVNSIKPKLKR